LFFLDKSFIRCILPQLPGEEAVRIGNDEAQLVELGSMTREVPVSIPGVVINSFLILSEGDDMPTDTIAIGVPFFPSIMAQMDNEAVEEMEATELVSGSNPEEDISFSDGSIKPGQRPLDSQATSHVSETQEFFGRVARHSFDSYSRKNSQSNGSL
jgi:hypothetical protein